MLKDRPIESPERGIPTQLAGPQNPPTIDDFEGDSDPASWAPKLPPIDDFEGDSDPASWAPKPSQNQGFRRGFRPS